MAIDIWLPSTQVAIELKYSTRELEWTTERGERFSLALGARDVMRYDFLKDIQRIEHVVRDLPPAYCGFAILLTNDPLLWNRPRRSDVVDAEFHIFDGRRIGDSEMRWGNHASDGTKRTREEPITLSHSYVLNWQDYRKFGAKVGEEFRYLAVTIPPAAVTIPPAKESTP